MDKEFKQKIEGQKSDKQDKIYWHDAFFAALQLELNDYVDTLIFESEHQLSKEALEVDVLIIKKAADISIEKNIGIIFKGHNLVEYKSETDNLTIWDYNKVYGYAMLYSSFEKIPIKDITISFVVTQKPIKLLDHLVNDRSFKITEIHPGIYYVENDAFPIQIIENKKLTVAENVFLKNLRSSLSQKELIEVIDAHRKYGQVEKVNVYLNRILGANKSVFKEVLAMFSTDVQEILNRHIQTSGIEERIRVEGQEEKARDTAIEMLKDGFSPDKIARYVKKPIEWVQNLMPAKQNFNN
jgi:hypothetical protein